MEIVGVSVIFNLSVADLSCFQSDRIRSEVRVRPRSLERIVFCWNRFQRSNLDLI